MLGAGGTSSAITVGDLNEHTAGLYGLPRVRLAVKAGRKTILPRAIRREAACLRRIVAGYRRGHAAFSRTLPGLVQIAPNRFASHFFLMENSDGCRWVSGTDLADEAFDFDRLGRQRKSEENRKETR